VLDCLRPAGRPTSRPEAGFQRPMSGGRASAGARRWPLDAVVLRSAAGAASLKNRRRRRLGVRRLSLLPWTSRGGFGGGCLSNARRQSPPRPQVSVRPVARQELDPPSVVWFVGMLSPPAAVPGSQRPLVVPLPAHRPAAPMTRVRRSRRCRRRPHGSRLRARPVSEVLSHPRGAGASRGCSTARRSRCPRRTRSSSGCRGARIAGELTRTAVNHHIDCLAVNKLRVTDMGPDDQAAGLQARGGGLHRPAVGPGPGGAPAAAARCRAGAGLCGSRRIIAGCHTPVAPGAPEATEPT
jgi:hypothetical protein